MRRLVLVVKIALGAFLALLVTWFEAVRRTPTVKRRKAARRARRRL